MSYMIIVVRMALFLVKDFTTIHCMQMLQSNIARYSVNVSTFLDDKIKGHDVIA